MVLRSVCTPYNLPPLPNQNLTSLAFPPWRLPALGSRRRPGVRDVIIAKLQKLPPLPPARLDLGSGRYSAPETWKRPSSGHARRYSAPKTCLGRRVQAATLTPKPRQPTLHQESGQVGVLRVQGTVSNHRGLTLYTDACWAPFSSSVSFITHTVSNHRGLTRHALVDRCQV